MARTRQNSQTAVVPCACVASWASKAGNSKRRQWQQVQPMANPAATPSLSAQKASHLHVARPLTNLAHSVIACPPLNHPSIPRGSVPEVGRVLLPLPYSVAPKTLIPEYPGMSPSSQQGPGAGRTSPPPLLPGRQVPAPSYLPSITYYRPIASRRRPNIRRITYNEHEENERKCEERREEKREEKKRRGPAVMHNTPPLVFPKHAAEQPPPPSLFAALALLRGPVVVVAVAAARSPPLSPSRVQDFADAQQGTSRCNTHAHAGAEGTQTARYIQGRTKAQTAGHRLMPMPIPLHDTVILPCHAMPCLSSPLPPGPAVPLASVPCCPSSALHVPATSNPVKCPTPSPIHPSTPALHDDPIAIHPPSHPAIQPAPSPLSVAQAQRLGWLTDRADSGGACHSCDRPSAQLRVGLPSCVVVVLASTDTDSRITAKQAGRRAN
ncbi:hypothetical protein PCL_06520 [Purpureocillium lilacinum]|uniref:Uncharacterized protein n=1 Tax=Purpureocillium lilacinum TaxID=33203 RepID=A0A2U3EN01_PURLI|nr:hypothetical protein PCL_06520 [Purpureocillium lilacinum]